MRGARGVVGSPSVCPTLWFGRLPPLSFLGALPIYNKSAEGAGGCFPWRQVNSAEQAQPFPGNLVASRQLEISPKFINSPRNPAEPQIVTWHHFLRPIVKETARLVNANLAPSDCKQW